jgi:two-component system, LytTR family, response regulator LytT
MKVLIIEDEALAAERLSKLLYEYDPGMQVIATLSAVETAVTWLQTHDLPDLILSDIHLADGLCFQIFKQVPVKCPVIFTTAYDQYALEAFQVHSIDYLLKPVQFSKLVHSLDKMQEMQRHPAPATAPSLPVNDLLQIIRSGEGNYKSRFLVKMGSKIKAVKTGDIAYFYSANKLTLLVTKENQKFPVDYALEELMQLLDPGLFFHINRKLIIHIDAAKEIHPYFKGRLKLVLQPPLDEDIVISSEKTPAFKSWLDQ